MKVGRLKRRALTSYFLTSGHRRGLVVLSKKSECKARHQSLTVHSGQGKGDILRREGVQVTAEKVASVQHLGGIH
jgi:hypothetical protein